MSKEIHLHITSLDDAGKEVVLFALSLDGERWFKVPKKFSALNDHKNLYEMSKVKNAAKACDKKNKYRRIKVKIDAEVKALYLDAEEDFVIKDDYLEEILDDFRPRKMNVTSTPQSTINQSTVKQTMAGDDQKQLLDFFLKKEQKQNDLSNLKNLISKMMIRKFDGKTNAKQWIESYENECTRLDIASGTLKVECLKSFLEDEIFDWYDANLLKFDNSDWSRWKQSFLDVYTIKGWGDVRHAYGFKYMFGSLVTYANAKEKKLLEADRNMPELYRVYLIVHGLPLDVQERLERDKTKDFQYLISKLAELDDTYLKKKSIHGVKNENTDKIKKSPLDKEKPRTSTTDKEACKFCIGCGFNNNYHPLERCWNKSMFDEARKRNREKRTKRDVNVAEVDQEHSSESSVSDSEYSTDSSKN